MLVVLVSALVGCASPEHEEGGLPGAADPSDAEHPRWLVDAWFHDDGREGYADYADNDIVLGEDGIGSYYDSHGIFDFTGEWKLVGHTLSVGDYTLDIAWTDNCAVISAEGKTFIGTIGIDRPDCPSTVPALSPLEGCIAGKWSSSSSDGYLTTSNGWTFGSDRAYLETWDYSGYTSGGSAGAVEGQWRVTEAGEIEISYPDGTSEVRGELSAFAGRNHDEVAGAGCDQSAFDAAIAGGCAQGDPYQCAGEDLRDCATQALYDCDQVCVDGGWTGASDPACGRGSDGYPVCLCE